MFNNAQEFLDHIKGIVREHCAEKRLRWGQVDYTLKRETAIYEARNILDNCSPADVADMMMDGSFPKFDTMEAAEQYWVREFNNYVEDGGLQYANDALAPYIKDFKAQLERGY